MLNPRWANGGITGNLGEKWRNFASIAHTMNAGKSTTLLQSSYNYRERDMNTLVYAAAIDDRFGVGKVTSRIGISQDAFLFLLETNLFDEINEHLKKEKVHCGSWWMKLEFLSKQQVYQLSDVVDKLQIPVLCYVLRTDFRFELFEGSKYLLAWAGSTRRIKNTLLLWSPRLIFVFAFK